MAAPRCWPVALLLLAAACRRTTSIESSHVEREIRARVKANPANVIAALVEVTAAGASRVWVEHGETSTYGEQTSKTRMPPNGVTIVPVIGLTPRATNHLRAHAEWPNGATADTPDLTFEAGALPPDIPASIEVKTSSDTVGGYVMIGLNQPKHEFYAAVMLDRRGKTRWYWAKNAAHFDRVRGNFLVADPGTDTFYELDLAGETRAAWHYGHGREKLDPHELVLLPNGNALMLGWEHRVADSRVFPGGVERSIRGDQTVDEMSPLGEVLFHWSTFDHIALEEIIPGRDFDPTNFEVVHANAIEPTPDGNVLVSFRSTSSIVKINRATGDVMWRLGGKKSDFRFIGDSFDGFSRQHDVRVLPNGDVMLFDNGNLLRKISRVVCYRLDEALHTATLTWEYRHVPDFFSPIAGSARRLPNGNTLVGWTMGWITEIDPSKKVVWEARTEPAGIYRALFTPTLYP